MADAPWFVYLLECRTARIYTGVTPQLDTRITSHRKGKGALFTRINQPQRLLAAKPFSSQREARQIEAQIKRMPSRGKRMLAERWSEEHPIDQSTQIALAVN